MHPPCILTRLSSTACVGSVQGLLLGNGKANAEAAYAAKQAGASSFVYVSVASEVVDARGWLPPFFDGYFDGKAQAESAISEAFADSATFVKPSFIYGGEEFGLFPPRVNSGYGSGVEELLSNGVITAVADKLPGLIKVALRPPVSVDAVAGACSAAALGSIPAGVLDGTCAINMAVGQPAASGLSDLGKALKAKLAQLTEEKA